MRKYRLDWLIRLTSGDVLILETKGQDTDQDQIKRKFLDEWVAAVNMHGGFGRWRWDVVLQPEALKDVLLAHSQIAP